MNIMYNVLIKGTKLSFFATFYPAKKGGILRMFLPRLKKIKQIINEDKHGKNAHADERNFGGGNHNSDSDKNIGGDKNNRQGRIVFHHVNSAAIQIESFFSDDKDASGGKGHPKGIQKYGKA